jgi:uncharacterized membrane protein/uncharacterized protein YegL
MVIGLALAGLMAAFGPHPDAVEFTIPVWLAERLSESGHRVVTLSQPAALWLMPLAVFPFLVAVVRRTLVDVHAGQIAIQLVARLLVLMAAALALSQPSLRSPIRGKTVVYVVDVSDSMDDGQLARAATAIDQGLAQLQEEDSQALDREDRTRLAVITYAGRARVREVGEDTDGAALVARHEGDHLASDHAGALRLAAALVDPQTEGRIVWFSDAGGSLAEREDLQVAARELQAQGVSLHARRVEPAARDDLLVEGVHLPAEMRVGETFEVSVDVYSTQATKVTLKLDRNGEPNTLEPSRELQLRPGTQEIKMPARVTEPGAAVFTARLDTETLPAELNRRTGNDEAAVVGEVRGRPRILLAGSGNDGPLASALKVDHLDVDTVGGAGVPQTFEEMRAYDLVIFSDLSARSVSGPSRTALQQYVEEHGGGFIMIGGENSFGVGGWGGTTVEGLLPVRFEGERQREQPKLALVLVIDKSGSMSSDDKLDLVKEAARATARTLDPTDELGVIAFDSRPHVLVRLQPASNRIRISADIRRLSSGGGTNALPALRESYLQLAGSNALVKHVILLSDGQSPENGINALLGDMRDADITVSSVGVGAGAGKDLLRRIANRGRGRFYYSHDGTDVPRIFSRETREVTRNAIKERSLMPRVAKNVQALRGIDFGGAPGLRGIVPVKPKSMSEVLLRTHLGEPLLVRGRRGLGRTAAFASDAKARWAARWVGWSGFAKLWSQIARDTMRQGATLLGGATVNIVPGADEGAYRVVVDVEAPQGFANDLAGEVEIIDPSVPVPDGADKTEPLTVPLELTAPGRYEAQILGVTAGQRLIKARLYDESQTPRRLAAEAVSQVSVPYPAELLPAASESGTEVMASLTAASTDGDLGEVLSSPGDAGGRERIKPLWPYVLFGLLVPLLVVDLLLRRVTFAVRRLTV